MALNQITYVDKVENGGTTDDGKVLATNMNEIKTVTNGVIDSLEDTVVKIGSNAGATAQGSFSIALGNDAGNNTMNTNSVAIGREAGKTSMGTQSVAIGLFAGRTSMGGSTVAIGANAGDDTMSSNSVAVGTNAGQTTMGINAVAIGIGAGQTSMGDNSVAIGNSAGKNSMGGVSVALGVNAGLSASGVRNTCLGNTAGSNLTTETDTTCLGFNAQVTATNQVQLGSSTTTTYAYGAVQDRSDERDKADIQDIHLGLDFIKALTPKSYKFDYREDYREHATELQDVVIGQDEEGNDITEEQEVFIPDTRKLGEIEHDGTHKRSRLHCGLIAQEVKQVMDAQGVDFSGYQDHSFNGGDDVLSLGYTQLIAPMIKAIQELEARIAVLEGA